MTLLGQSTGETTVDKPFRLLSYLSIVLIGVAPTAGRLSASSPASKLALREKEPPAKWKLADLNKDMPYHWKAGAVHVLVWERIDNGGSVMERCLVIKQY